jgi:hypothetical protein
MVQNQYVVEPSPQKSEMPRDVAREAKHNTRALKTKQLKLCISERIEQPNLTRKFRKARGALRPVADPGFYLRVCDAKKIFVQFGKPFTIW